jgi:hypothetical protein
MYSTAIKETEERVSTESAVEIVSAQAEARV